jgi:hypothetical protein
MSDDAQGWKRCSSCKKPIDFGATWWACNVSTCNRPRTGLIFCTVSCWDAHLSVVNHRESWALERKAPSRAEWAREQAGSGGSGAASIASSSGSSPGRAATPSAPRKIFAPSAPTAANKLEREVLIVVSKLKAYVRARSGFNTSDQVMQPLSDAVRELCDRAIEKARAEGRMTVLDRDFD